MEKNKEKIENSSTVDEDDEDIIFDDEDDVDIISDEEMKERWPILYSIMRKPPQKDYPEFSMDRLLDNIMKLIYQEEPPDYVLIACGKLISGITLATPDMDDPEAIDSKAGKVTIPYQGLEITLPYFAITTAKGRQKKISATDTTGRLFTYIVERLTEVGFPKNAKSIEFPLRDYMEVCGLSDYKSAVEQASRDLKILSEAEITWKRTGETIGGGFLKIASFGDITYSAKTRKGTISFAFSDEFCRAISKKPVFMPFPNRLLTTDSRRNPYMRKLGYRNLEHKKMNLGKNNENTISVKTLLKSCGFPSEKQIKEHGQHYQQQIIEPFERDMDALGYYFSWEYCHSNGQPLSEEELASMDYWFFKTLLVKLEWHYYPEEYAKQHLKTRTEHEKKAAQARKRREQKAKEKAEGEDKEKIEKKGEA